MSKFRTVTGFAALIMTATAITAMVPHHASAAVVSQLKVTKMVKQTVANHTLINTILNNQITLAIGLQPSSPAKIERSVW